MSKPCVVHCVCPPRVNCSNPSVVSVVYATGGALFKMFQISKRGFHLYHGGMRFTLCSCSLLIVSNRPVIVKCRIMYLIYRPQLYAFILLALGIWLSGIISGSSLHLSLLWINSFVLEFRLQIAAEHVHKRFRLHQISRTVGHVLHIVWFRQILAGMIIILIRSHVVGMVGHNVVRLLTQILSYAKFLFSWLFTEFNALNRAYKSHLFNEHAHCSPLVFAQIGRPGCHYLIQEVLLFQVMTTCSGSTFPQGFVAFLFFS